MGKRGQGQVQETAAQRANAQRHLDMWNDFKTRVAPQIKLFAKQTERAYEANSAERREATTMGTADASAKFGMAGDKALTTESNAGGLGSARQKLGMTGMGDDLATSVGKASVAADQGVDQAYTQRMGAVAALGRGEKTQALQGFNQQAGLSGMQAEADAEESLQRRAGNVGLASKMIGAGIGGWMNRSPGLGGTNDFQGVNGTNANEKFLRYGTSGD